MYGYGQPVIWGTVTNTNPPTMTAPVIPPAVPASDAKPSGTTPTETKKSPGMGANLKFTVPTATKLYIDGQLTSASGTERLFSTPPLAVGQKFYYDVKAELSVNGTAVVQEMRVIVESGANINESFGKLFAAVQDPNAVAGK